VVRFNRHPSSFDHARLQHHLGLEVIAAGLMEELEPDQQQRLHEAYRRDSAMVLGGFRELLEARGIWTQEALDGLMPPSSAPTWTAGRRSDPCLCPRFDERPGRDAK